MTDTTRRLDDLKLDPVYGFPRAWTTDRADNGYNGRFSTDGGYWGTTVYFAPAAPLPPCGGLRRLFARCPFDPFTPLTPRTVGTMARPTWDRILPLPPRDSSVVDRAVRVRYIIDSSGDVVSGSAVIVSAATPGVAQAVQRVAEWWTFSPATLHGRPVAVRAEEELVFRATRRGCTTGEDALQVVARDTLPDGVPRIFLDVARCGKTPSESATRYLPGVIKSPGTLAAFEDADRRSTSRGMTYHQALDVFLALWEEARLLNPRIGEDWREDVQCDIEIARVLNARP